MSIGAEGNPSAERAANNAENWRTPGAKLEAKSEMGLVDYLGPLEVPGGEREKRKKGRVPTSRMSNGSNGKRIRCGRIQYWNEIASNPGNWGRLGHECERFHWNGGDESTIIGRATLAHERGGEGP